MRTSEYTKQRMKMAKEAKRRQRQAHAMRQAGMTLQAIGDALGISKQGADYMIRKYQRSIEEGSK